MGLGFDRRTKDNLDARLFSLGQEAAVRFRLISEPLSELAQIFEWERERAKGSEDIPALIYPESMAVPVMCRLSQCIDDALAPVQQALAIDDVKLGRRIVEVDHVDLPEQLNLVRQLRAALDIHLAVRSSGAVGPVCDYSNEFTCDEESNWDRRYRQIFTSSFDMLEASMHAYLGICGK